MWYLYFVENSFIFRFYEKQDNFLFFSSNCTTNVAFCCCYIYPPARQTYSILSNFFLFFVQFNYIQYCYFFYLYSLFYYYYLFVQFYLIFAILKILLLHSKNLIYYYNFPHRPHLYIFLDKTDQTKEKFFFCSCIMIIIFFSFYLFLLNIFPVPINIQEQK